MSVERGVRGEDLGPEASGAGRVRTVLGEAPGSAARERYDMKPVEYWVCAVRADEPECWDGPYETAARAFAVRDRSFATPAFEVYEVTARRVARPKPPPPPRIKPVPAPKVRTRSVRPKAERTPRSKGRR